MTIPVGDIIRWRTDASLEFAVPKFRVELARGSSAPATAIDAPTEIQVALEPEQWITAVRDGVVRSVRLEGRPERQITVLEGVDASADLLNASVRMRFVPPPAPPVVDTLAKEDLDDGVAELVGIFPASEVAATICAKVGLSVVWGCPDYLIREDFDAIGRVIDILARLVEPWNLTEPERVDILVEERTVLLVQRVPLGSLAGGGVAAVKDARLDSVTYRRSRLPIWGRVELTGTSTATRKTVDEPARVTTTSDGEGILTRTTIRERFVEPGHILIRSVESTEGRQYRTILLGGAPQVGWQLEKLSEKTTIYNYPGLAIGGNALAEAIQQVGTGSQRGNIRQARAETPRLTTEVTSTLGRTTVFSQQPGFPPEAHPGFFEIERLETYYTYDKVGYLETRTQRRFQADLAPTGEIPVGVPGPLKLTEETVESYSNARPDVVSRRTEIRKIDPDGAGTLVEVVVSDVARSERPGGPSALATRAGLTPRRSVATISADPRAQDVRYHNPHLESAQLAIIMGQLERTSGAIQHEVDVVSRTLPDAALRQVVTLTDAQLEDGTTLTIGPAYVAALSKDFDVERAQYLTRATLLWWTAA